MNYEVKTYKFICERCQKIEFVRDVSSWQRPVTWVALEVNDCGLTNYTRFDDLCPDCSSFIKKKVKD